MNNFTQVVYSVTKKHFFPLVDINVVGDFVFDVDVSFQLLGDGVHGNTLERLSLEILIQKNQL